MTDPQATPHPDYPEKTCSIDRLITHDRLVEAALSGNKTQQRRAGVYAYPGETVDLKGHTLTVTALRRERYGDMTDSDALAEGYPSLEMYRELIRRMHGGADMSDDQPVWVHEFSVASP
ncbi:MAG: ASCH domain-containing protein [Planctomycetaceae bacterium]|nr:ASCH domain-containing protein [Planctomycetaceae bacterium]